MHNLKISIITPSLNQGRYIEQTIKSVLNQNYRSLEYIIIDGGSEDDSVNIIRKYERHLTYWVSEKDKGQTHAINKGIEKVTGDILAYLNSDDIYLHGTLNKIAGFFYNNPGIDVVYGNCLIIDENGRIIKRIKEINFDYTMGCCIGFGLIIPQPAAFIRRRVIREVGFFDESLNFNMDAEYWFRCTQKGMKFRHIPFYLAGFRWHTNSKTKSAFQHTIKPRENERFRLKERAYNTLNISRYIPFNKSKPLRYAYRLKRIFLKLITGCYFA